MADLSGGGFAGLWAMYRNFDRQVESLFAKIIDGFAFILYAGFIIF